MAGRRTFADGVDEGLVDLEVVELERLKRGEIRIAGAEIVYGDAESAVMERADHRTRQGGIGEGALGGLDDEMARLYLQTLRQAGQQIDRRVAVEVGGRQVHADMDVGTARRDFAGFPPEKVHHALGDSPDEPDFLRDRNEQVGPDHLATGPPPSDQRLRADPAARRQFHDRLIDDEELVSPERRLDRRRHRKLGPREKEDRDGENDRSQEFDRQENGRHGIGALLDVGRRFGGQRRKIAGPRCDERDNVTSVDIGRFISPLERFEPFRLYRAAGGKNRGAFD